MTAPDFTLQGHPSHIQRQATELAVVAEELEQTGASLGRITADGWTGRAADAFRASFEGEPRDWLDAADAFGSAARALSTYATVLEVAQASAAAAAASHARGEALSSEARREHSRDLAAHRRAANEVALVGVWTFTPEPIFVDRGAAVCQQAIVDLESARAAVAEALNQAVR